MEVTILTVLLTSATELLTWCLSSAVSIVTTAMGNDYLQIPMIAGIMGLAFITFKTLMPRMGRN